MSSAGGMALNSWRFSKPNTSSPPTQLPEIPPGLHACGREGGGGGKEGGGVK